MADGSWEALDKGTQDAWEDQFQDPDEEFTAPHRRDESREREDDGTRIHTIIDIYSYANIAGENSAAHLVHKCNKCNGGHVHELRAVEGFAVSVAYQPLHVGEDQFGQGLGTLYSAVKVTGQLLRPIETRTRRNAQAAPQVEIVWEIKELDHIEHRDLVVLEELDTVVDCVLGVQESSISYQEPDTEIFALALARVPILAEDAGWIDEGGVVRDLAEALPGLERPSFRFEGGLGAAEMVLVQYRGKRTVEVGRVAMDVSRDGKTVKVKRYTPTKG